MEGFGQRVAGARTSNEFDVSRGAKIRAFEQARGDDEDSRFLPLAVSRSEVEPNRPSPCSTRTVKHLVRLSLVSIQEVSELALLRLDVGKRVLDGLVGFLGRNDLRVEARDLKTGEGTGRGGAR